MFFAPMPKASIDKDHDPLLSKSEIWFARQ
jgi:hypothetical protein